MFISEHISANIFVSFVRLTEPAVKEPREYHLIHLQRGAISIAPASGGEGFILREADICIIPPGGAVRYEPLGDNLGFDVNVDSGFISSIIPAGFTLRCHCPLGDEAGFAELHDILMSVATSYTANNSLAMCALMYRLGDCLVRGFLQKSRENVAGSAAAERVGRIRAYIEQNYYMPLTLQAISSELYLSPQYLSRFIRQHLGETFMGYLTRVRLKHAAGELANTKLPLSGIAHNNGFSNLAAMSKAFIKAYGQSPAEYRRAQADRPAAAQPSPNVQPLVVSMAPVPAELSLQADAGAGAVRKACWGTVNIGQLSIARCRPFQRLFPECRRRLGFRYVRFNNPFTDDLLRFDEAAGQYDFSLLDRIFDGFLAADCLPFMELSYKPPKPDGFYESGYITGERLYEGERRNDYYEAALEAFLRHCINRYGRAWVAGWRFEVWLKHDEELAFLLTPEQYAQKYRRLYRIVKALLPECPVGGFGFNTCADSEMFRRYLSYFSAAGLTFDFFSINCFAYDKSRYRRPADEEGAPLGILSANPNHLVTEFRLFRDMIRAVYPAELPILVTEFNSCISRNNFSSRTAFQAAYLLKNMIDMLGETEAVAYWTLCDSASDFEGAQPLPYPGFGLVDRYGLRYPAFFAFEMLAALYANELGRSQNHIVTASPDGRYRILVFHYVHFNAGFCMNHNLPVPLEDSYTLYEDAQPLHIELTVDHIAPGSYRVTRAYLSRQSGSLLDEYLRVLQSGAPHGHPMSALQDIRDRALRQEQAACAPRQEYSYAACTGKLGFKLNLAPHEICFIDVEPLS